MPSFNPAQREVAKKVWGADANPKVAKEEKENIRHLSYFENEESILEQIIPATRATSATRAPETAFLKFDKYSGSTEVINEYQDPDVPDLVYQPIKDELLSTGAISLPSGVEEYGNTKDLINDIKKFLDKYFEVPGFYEKLLPYLVLFYWVYEKFPFVPYLHFVGRTATGKSTAMEVLGSICYKPIDASGAVTIASIFRVASTWRGTLLLDEFTSGGDNYHEMISFLKSGVSNKVVLRVEGDKEKSVRAYIVKSPKMFTSEDPITDAGLQSRTMVIRMQKNRRPVPLYRLNSYKIDATILRNKLLLYRFRTLNSVDLTDIEYGFKELSVFDSRVQQVITPIYYLSDEDTRVDILGFAKEQQEETVRERREALPGQIFQVIADSYPAEPALKFITSEINKLKNSEKDYTEKRIANNIRKILGFNIKRTGHENISVVDLSDNEKFQELYDYYGLHGENTLFTTPPVLEARVAGVASVATTVQTTSEEIITDDLTAQEVEAIFTGN